MSEFIMLCGLPASGKSTLAEELSKKHNATILSSDVIREELLNDVNNQEHNSKVFEIMNGRAKALLDSGINVIYDATNLNRKRRLHLINHEVKADKKIVHCLIRNYDDLIFYDKQRERTVGEIVIKRMYKNFEIPTKNEDWDKVVLDNNGHKTLSFKNYYEKTISKGLDHDELFSKIDSLPVFDDIKDIPQDSKYHSFSVSRHTYYVYKYILDNYHKEDKLMILWSALFHDIGKGFCKSFINYKGETQRYANFIGHEYVSAQIAAYWLYTLNYDDQFIKDVVDLIQFHMMPMKARDKKMQQVRQLIGDELYEKLMFLHEADMQAK